MSKKNLKSVTVVNAIKDILLMVNLSFLHHRGQTYNGANNMIGKKS